MLPLLSFKLADPVVRHTCASSASFFAAESLAVALTSRIAFSAVCWSKL